jgi:hypothetical protein
MRRYEELTDQQRGLVVMALLGYAIVTTVVKAALAGAVARSVRRGWRARRLGPVRAAGAAVDRVLVAAVAANVAHGAASKWAVRAVDSGRGRVWLERADRWLTAWAERSRTGAPGSADPAG